MSKDQSIREAAYAIWEAEGRPDGQAEDHWARAEIRVNEQPLGKPAASPVAKKSRTKKATAAAENPAVSVGGG